MDSKTEPVNVNFAITREDAVHIRAAQAELAMRGFYRVAARVLGACFLAAAVALASIPALRRTYRWACAAAAVCGVSLLFLWQPLLKTVVMAGAAEDFEAGRFGTPARAVRFSPQAVEFRAERYEAAIPYDMLWLAYEDKNVLLLYPGIGECHAVPKRALSKRELEAVNRLLTDRMRQKFLQEGAREWTK